MSKSEFFELVELISGPWFRFINTNDSVEVVGGHGVVFVRDNLCCYFLLSRDRVALETPDSNIEWLHIGSPDSINRMRAKFMEVFGDA